MWILRRGHRGGGTCTGIRLLPDGVAAALVERPAGAPPVLARCRLWPGTTAQALGALSHDRAVRRAPVVAVADPDSYTLLLVEPPEVPAQELREAVRWRVRELIDFPVEEAVIDIFDAPAPRTGMAARTIYAVVARVAALEPVVDAIEQARLPLEVIDIPELALRNLTALLPEDAGGVALVHFEGPHGVLVITCQGTLYLARRLEFAADLLLAAEDAGEDAEHGALDALAVEIQRSLDYYESNFGQPPASGVVLAPQAVPLSFVPRYLSAQLGITVRVCDLNDMLDSREALAFEQQAVCFTAVGAALREAA